MSARAPEWEIRPAGWRARLARRAMLAFLSRKTAWRRWWYTLAWHLAYPTAAARREVRAVHDGLLVDLGAGRVTEDDVVRVLARAGEREVIRRPPIA